MSSSNHPGRTHFNRMQHRVVLRLFAILSLISAILCISACGGGGSKAAISPTPSAIAVTPNPLSLDFGKTANLSASVTNATGTVLSNVTVTFASSDETLVTVATNGVACAGVWDSKTTPIVCQPATHSGVAN